MNNEKFQALYKNTKKEEIIEELYYKCKANYELVSEIERLKNNWDELRKWIVNNKHNENTEERYLVVDYGTLLDKMSELKGGSK